MAGPVAGAIAKCLREDREVLITAVGPASVTKCVQAMALARNALRAEGLELFFFPGFEYIIMQGVGPGSGKQHSCVRVHVWPESTAPVEAAAQAAQLQAPEFPQVGDLAAPFEGLAGSMDGVAPMEAPMEAMAAPLAEPAGVDAAMLAEATAAALRMEAVEANVPDDQTLLQETVELTEPGAAPVAEAAAAPQA